MPATAAPKRRIIRRMEERSGSGRYELRREPRSGVSVVVVWWVSADGARMQVAVIGNDGAVAALGRAVAEYLAGRQRAELPALGLVGARHG